MAPILCMGSGILSFYTQIRTCKLRAALPAVRQKAGADRKAGKYPKKAGAEKNGT